jgi:capsule polysaccharide export protein KpsE/RkpR
VFLTVFSSVFIVVKELNATEAVCEANIEQLAKEIGVLEPQIRRLKAKYEEIEKDYEEKRLKAELLGKEKDNFHAVFEEITQKQAEKAFKAYMNEQMGTFNNIAKTYGKNV